MSGRARAWQVLAVIGLIVPIVVTVIFLSEHGLDFGEMADQVFASEFSTLLILDLGISAAAFWIWLFREAPRLDLNPWPFVAATLFIGLCFALPLFLYLRETRQNQLVS